MGLGTALLPRLHSDICYWHLQTSLRGNWNVGLRACSRAATETSVHVSIAAEKWVGGAEIKTRMVRLASQEQRENFEKPVIDEETGQHIRKDTSATAKEAFQALKEVCCPANVHGHMYACALLL